MPIPGHGCLPPAGATIATRPTAPVSRSAYGSRRHRQRRQRDRFVRRRHDDRTGGGNPAPARPGAHRCGGRGPAWSPPPRCSAPASRAPSGSACRSPATARSGRSPPTPGAPAASAIAARGYARYPLADLPLNARGKFDVAGVIGRGRLQVTKSYEIGQPYVGVVPLETGEIGEDIASYLANSQQIPSIVALGVLAGPTRHPRRRRRDRAADARCGRRHDRPPRGQRRRDGAGHDADRRRRRRARL